MAGAGVGITDSVYQFGKYTPNENSITLKPRNSVIPASQRKFIIGIHGHGSDALYGVPGWNHGDHMQWWVDQGYWYIAIDAGGTVKWGNIAVINAFLGVYGYAKNTLGMYSGNKVFLDCWSMGGYGGFNIIKQQSALIAGAIMWAPGTYLDYFHTGSYTAEIDAAYTTPDYASGTYATNSVGYKVFDEYPTWRDKCPITIYHGTADPTVPIQHSRNFVAGVNQPQVSLVELTGRNHTDLFSGPSWIETKALIDAGAW